MHNSPSICGGSMAAQKKRTPVATYDTNLFEAFVADPILGQAIEALKRANDVFDIIDPQETQHSEMLQWLLNPREGHGQGDAMFKDFLTAAQVSCEVENGHNADFFAYWTPSRITMTGFHSLLLFREYQISPENKLDFFLVDPVNGFIIVVENKYKALHDNAQLTRYRKAVGQLARHPTFKDYHVALIALDKGRSKEREVKELVANWVYVDYLWLRSGASRAEAQLKRGNQSASLLISYCQRQAGYESQAERHVDTLLSRLTRGYRPLLKPLAEARAKRLNKDQSLTLGDPASDLWLFAQHYPELVTRLTRLKNLSFVKAEVEAAVPGAKFDHEVGDKWIRLFDKNWHQYTQAEEVDVYWWPFFIRVEVVAPQYMTEKDQEVSETRYVVSVVYREPHVRTENAPRIHVAMVKAFPELTRGAQKAGVRRLMKEEVKESSLISEVQRRYRLLAGAIQAA